MLMGRSRSPRHRNRQPPRAERGIGAVVGSRKARLWDAYAGRWKEKGGAPRQRPAGCIHVILFRTLSRLNATTVFASLCSAMLQLDGMSAGSCGSYALHDGYCDDGSGAGLKVPAVIGSGACAEEAGCLGIARSSGPKGCSCLPHHLQQGDPSRRAPPSQIEGAPRHALSMGVRRFGDRSRPGAAEQVAVRRVVRVMRRTAPLSTFRPTVRRRHPSTSLKAPPNSWCGSRCQWGMANTREVDDGGAQSASRYLAAHLRCSSIPTATLRVEEEIDVAYPRLSFELPKDRAKPRRRPGSPWRAAIQVRDKTIIFDEKFAPAVLMCTAHPVVDGWIDRVIDSIVYQLAGLSLLLDAARASYCRGRAAECRLFRPAAPRTAIPVPKALCWPFTLRASGVARSGVPAVGRGGARDLRGARAAGAANTRPTIMTTWAAPVGAGGSATCRIFLKRPARAARHPAGKVYRAGAERLRLHDPRPRPFPQCDFRARSSRATAAPEIQMQFPNLLKVGP